MRRRFVVVAAAVLMMLAGNVWAVDVGAFVRKDKFIDIKLSPSGDYLAATMPVDDKTALVVMRRKDLKLTGSFMPGMGNHVHDFNWVSDERVLIGLSQKLGLLDEPQPTGELFAMNADGSRSELLVGYRVRGNGLGTRLQPKAVENVAAFLTDRLPDDDKGVVVSIWPMIGQDPFTRAERLDVMTGRRTVLARSPVRRGRFATDNQGIVRFAYGAGVDNANQLHYRSGPGVEWELINHELTSGRIETPVGFSDDNRVAYLRVEQPDGPDAIVAWDLQTRERRQVLRNERADPRRIIYRNWTSVPVGALVVDGRSRSVFFDEASPEARMYRSLEAAFGGDSIYVTSSTRDGRLLLVQTWSGTNPGDFFIYDTQAKSAEHLVSRSDWVDPDAMAKVTPFSMQARDGLALHGYLTLPKGDGRKPMVVVPHGGPYGIYDTWGYDREAQLLAAAGYAVLQVNYRGSGNFGRSFQQAGARQWGGSMQDDLTDATRWAVAQGHADASKICIYGASYGAYAALMGAAKEPSLYQCAAGYVGVYDLPMMQRESESTRRSLGNWSKEWVGDDNALLAAASPNRIAERIKIPVFLAAGGEDEIAPVKHTELMEAALKKNGVAVESLYYRTEGHGFYTEPHQREYYTRLLAFLSRSLGGAAPAPSQP